MALKKKRHRCTMPENARMDCGIAIDECWEDRNKLFVGNGEYANQVNFCPFCGYAAKKLIKNSMFDKNGKLSENFMNAVLAIVSTKL